jgi:C_GCAxxG_C_C family probable redox protein
MNDESVVAALAKKAHDLGFYFEKEFRGCGQCFIAAVYDTLDLPYDALFKSMSGLAGGVGMINDGNCGAYIGGVLILSNFVGRERGDFKDNIGKRFEAYRLARKLRDRFVERYGSVTCGDIHQKIFGRYFNLLDSEQMALFDEMGGHSDKCPEVVGGAAAWVIEILNEEGLIPVFGGEHLS